jgi:hypothetical protein
VAPRNEQRTGPPGRMAPRRGAVGGPAPLAPPRPGALRGVPGSPDWAMPNSSVSARGSPTRAARKRAVRRGCCRPLASRWGCWLTGSASSPSRSGMWTLVWPGSSNHAPQPSCTRPAWQAVPACSRPVWSMEKSANSTSVKAIPGPWARLPPSRKLACPSARARHHLLLARPASRAANSSRAPGSGRSGCLRQSPPRRLGFLRRAGSRPAPAPPSAELRPDRRGHQAQRRGRVPDDPEVVVRGGGCADGTAPSR